MLQAVPGPRVREVTVSAVWEELTQSMAGVEVEGLGRHAPLLLR